MGSRLHGVWGDLNVGSLTLASITSSSFQTEKKDNL